MKRPRRADGYETKKYRSSGRDTFTERLELLSTSHRPSASEGRLSMSGVKRSRDVGYGSGEYHPDYIMEPKREEDQSLPAVKVARTNDSSEKVASKDPEVSVAFATYPSYSHSTTGRKSVSSQEVVVSTVYVNHRLYKLKAEILNMLAIFPEYTFSWDVDQFKELKVSVPAGSLDQKQYNALFITLVQAAATAQDVMNALLLLEDSLPMLCLARGTHRESLGGFAPDSSANNKFGANRANKTLPVIAHTASAVACRLFSLDRALRYESLPADYYNVLATSAGVSKCCIDHTPRCKETLQCQKPLIHFGRCIQSYNEGPSRLPDIRPALDKMLLGVIPYFSEKRFLKSVISGSTDGSTIISRPDPRYSQMSEDVDKEFHMAMMNAYVRQSGGRNSDRYNKFATHYQGLSGLDLNAEIDISDAQPYVPRAEEISESAWI